jgi:hypothetical protein
MLKMARSNRTLARGPSHQRTNRGGRDGQHHASGWHARELLRTPKFESD